MWSENLAPNLNIGNGHTVCKLLSLKSLLTEKKSLVKGPLNLYYDDQVVAYIANNLDFHECTNTMKFDVTLSGKKVENRVTTPNISLVNKLANMFTKALT